MKFVTKKNTVLVLVIVLLIYTGIQLYAFNLICTSDGVYNYDCGKLFFSLKFFSLYIGILLFPSVFTLPFPIIVFERWKRFAKWAVPVVVILTLILTLSKEGGAFFSYGFSGFFLVILYAWFAIHSLTLIAYTAIKEHRKV